MNHSPLSASENSEIKFLAHRGLVSERVPENTLAAFQAAMDAGASIIETDVWATRDGVSVIFHDEDFTRLAGLDSKISELTYAEARAIDLGAGQHVISLEDALLWFPALQFNVDIKVRGAIKPTAETINRLRVQQRVLISSFSERRRLATLRRVEGPIRSSAGTAKVIALVILSQLGIAGLIRWATRTSQALQIPRRAGVIRLDSSRFIRRMQSIGLEVHYWTINDVSEARELFLAGANGIVTDRVDVMISTLQQH